MSQQGAMMSPRLEARIHHTLGRAVNASSDQAILLGEELIQTIKLEVESAYRRGTEHTGHKAHDRVDA